MAHGTQRREFSQQVRRSEDVKFQAPVLREMGSFQNYSPFVVLQIVGAV